MELPIIHSSTFQRLRQIKQMGFSEFSYPGAVHARYSHSIGAMATASRVFQAIFYGELEPPDHGRFWTMTRLAALLHDVGHGPLSHTSEFAMPKVGELKVPGVTADRQATHEDYTLKMILDGELTPLINEAGKDHGFEAAHVAGLIDENYPVEKEDVYCAELEGQVVNLRPILHQIISSEVDADRMDYLRRDSHHAGVSYGHFDFDWLSRNFTYHTEGGKCYLAIKHRGLWTFEDFLIARYHMFLMVYFHHKSVIYETMLRKYFTSGDCGYVLPPSLEDYLQCTDAHLHTHLKDSKNEWARRVSDHKPYVMLIELHSGIPSGEAARRERDDQLIQVRDRLGRANIEFLEETSKGELSKYFRRPGVPLYVLYDDQYHRPSFIPLEECTDLFEKYSKSREITRLYVPQDQLSQALA